MKFGEAFIAARAAALAIPSRPATRQLNADEMTEIDRIGAAYPPAAPQVYRTARPLTSERLPIPPLAQNIAVQVMQEHPASKDSQARLIMQVMEDLRITDLIRGRLM